MAALGSNTTRSLERADRLAFVIVGGDIDRGGDGCGDHRQRSDSERAFRTGRRGNHHRPRDRPATGRWSAPPRHDCCPPESSCGAPGHNSKARNDRPGPRSRPTPATGWSRWAKKAQSASARPQTRYPTPTPQLLRPLPPRTLLDVPFYTSNWEKPPMGELVISPNDRIRLAIPTILDSTSPLFATPS